MKNAKSFLILNNLSKFYGETCALNEVNIEITKGSIHALLGENGAGKSTTMKIISGMTNPSSGKVLKNGEELKLGSVNSAHAEKINTAFQELTLLEDLSIIDNFLLNSSFRKHRIIFNKSKYISKIKQHFIECKFEINLELLIKDLTLSVRQKIEIVKSLYNNPDIVLLDEPTSSLSGSDVVWLGQIIKKCKQKGVTVIFISHRLPEVRAFCEKISILKNGKHILTSELRNISDDEIIKNIVGRSLDIYVDIKSKEKYREYNKIALELNGVSGFDKVRSINLNLFMGKIHGIAALQGMGQKELFEMCFGESLISEGHLLINGKITKFTSPTDAVKAGINIGFIPEERKTEGLFLDFNGIFNASLPSIKKNVNNILLNYDLEIKSVAQIFEKLDVTSRALFEPVKNFSGGNQQKISIAKWLLADSKILLLFDPTRGIDVGTKQQVYKLMRDYVNTGGTILFYSTEIFELANICDAVSVMYEGKITQTFAGNDIDEAVIIEKMLGGKNHVFI